MTVPRETSALKALNAGWPFGPGPGQWRWRIEHQPATPIQDAGLHLVCAACGQSITRLGAWAHTLASLTPQIAAHVMQVHSGAAVG